MEAIPDVKINVTESSKVVSSSLEILKVINLDLFNSKHYDTPELIKESKLVADCLHEYGVVIIKDTRVTEEDNSIFLDMMERYFEQETEKKMSDARPQYHYQVGVTPEHVEKPKNHCSRMKNLPKDAQPHSLCPPEVDPKWRYFWRIGDQPSETKFKQLNAEAVIPQQFIKEWPVTMDNWGNKMLNALYSVAGMAAIGLDLDPLTFINRMKHGPHLLAPTGSNFNKFGNQGTVLAGYHYDLNFLTIHGKSRFPGLYVWLRDGRKVLVRVPENCLLLQAGKQFEYLTAGYVMSGFHEVVVAPETLPVIERKRKEGESLWRVSSTLFGHIASDNILGPVGHFADSENAIDYPPMLTGDHVQSELKAIALAK